MLTRRRFLKWGSAGFSFLSLGGVVPALFAQSARSAAVAAQNDRVLVVVELFGGNDGLNTVIPVEDRFYYKNRSRLGIPKEKALKLSDQVGLHPRLAALGELFQQGQVAVVQGIGYPEPDRSHFRSMEIWHTASTDKKPSTAGWLGQYLDATAKPGEEGSLRGAALTGELPQALQAERVVVPVLQQLDSLPGVGTDAPRAARLLRRLSTSSGAAAEPGNFVRRQVRATYQAAEQLQKAAGRYRSEVQYPQGALGPQLRRAAQLIAADLGVRVLFVSQDGYDTHSRQTEPHGNLLEELGSALAAFQRDLTALKVAEKVVVLVFSEFGRRVDENASLGTDHGAASVALLVGARVKGGLAGRYPSLEKLGEGDLVFTTDFRSVYATLLEGWLGCPAEKLLGGKFPTLNVLDSRGS